MSTTTRATKQIIKTYKSISKAKEITRQKLDALLETNALYKLFEHEEKHPYYNLSTSAENSTDKFEVLVAGLLDWSIEGSSIAEELDKIKAKQIVDGAEADETVDALRAVQPVAMNGPQVADALVSVFYSTTALWSHSDAGIIQSKLIELHGKKNAKKHKEVEELKISKDCRSAVNDVKKLAKELLMFSDGTNSIHRELEKKQVMRGLTGQGKDSVIEFLIKK
jgi:hypothetical protein